MGGRPPSRATRRSAVTGGSLFADPQLNALEDQVDGANQTLKQAEANFRAARAAIGVSRAARAPSLSVGPSAGAVRDSANEPYFNKSAANAGTGNFLLPFDLNYEVDLWGRVRRSITAAVEQAQASAADRETARLSLHAELAMDYFDLRGDDAQDRLLAETVEAYEAALRLTEDRYEGGAAPESDVTQARTQLLAAQAARTDLAVQRAASEHAIAVLTGKPPAALTIPPLPLTIRPPVLPAVPGALPSQLLERRPDIAAEERRMAAANEQIGIAQAAFYPTLSISALGGFAGHVADQLADLAEPPLGGRSGAVPDAFRSWPPALQPGDRASRLRRHRGGVPANGADRVSGSGR